MDANRHRGVRPGIEHIPHAQQRFCAPLVKDGTRVNLARYGEGDTRRNVGLDKTGNHVNRRTLGRQHQVNARRARFLRQTRNQFFHLLTDGHHQIGEFIHQHHDVRQFFQHRMHGVHTVARFPVRIRDRASHACGLSDLLVVARQITHAQRRHQLITALHFIDAPAQRIGGVFHVGDHFRQQMRDTFVHRQLKHFRVDHDETNVFRLRLIEHAEDHGVHADRFTRTSGTGNQQMRHFRQIGHHRIAGDIFAQHHGKRRWVLAEFRTIEHFAQVYGLAFFVR